MNMINTDICIIQNGAASTLAPAIWSPIPNRRYPSMCMTNLMLVSPIDRYLHLLEDRPRHDLPSLERLLDGLLVEDVEGVGN